MAKPKLIHLQIAGISLGFGVAGKHCQEIGKIYCFIVQPNGPIFKVAVTEGKVGGCFCRLPALNENTGLKIAGTDQTSFAPVPVLMVVKLSGAL